MTFDELIITFELVSSIYSTYSDKNFSVPFVDHLLQHAKLMSKNTGRQYTTAQHTSAACLVLHVFYCKSFVACLLGVKVRHVVSRLAPCGGGGGGA